MKSYWWITCLTGGDEMGIANVNLLILSHGCSSEDGVTAEVC